MVLCISKKNEIELRFIKNQKLAIKLRNMMNNHKIEVFLTEGKVKINETVEALENCCTVMASPGMANWVL